MDKVSISVLVEATGIGSSVWLDYVRKNVAITNG